MPSDQDKHDAFRNSFIRQHATISIFAAKEGVKQIAVLHRARRALQPPFLDLLVQEV